MNAEVPEDVLHHKQKPQITVSPGFTGKFCQIQHYVSADQCSWWVCLPFVLVKIHGSHRRLALSIILWHVYDYIISLSLNSTSALFSYLIAQCSLSRSIVFAFVPFPHLKSVYFLLIMLIAIRPKVPEPQCLSVPQPFVTWCTLSEL